jgi:cytochrome P450
VQAAFTPRQANQLRPLMQRVITELLDEWAPAGEMDFAVFASYFPVAVMCGILGVPSSRIPSIRTALENQLKSLTLDPAAKPLFMAGWEVLWQFAEDLVRERNRTPTRCLTSSSRPNDPASSMRWSCAS